MIPVPAPLGTRYIKVSIGYMGNYVMGLLSNGDVRSWGNFANMPVPVPLLPTGLRYVDIAAGEMHAVFLRSDGAVLAVGNNWYGQCNIPTVPTGRSVVSVTPLAMLLDNGSILTWGTVTTAPWNAPALPPGMRYTKIERQFGNYCLAMRSDGNIVAWGDNQNGTVTVPPLPGGTKYEAVSGAPENCVAWRSDGVFVVWGSGASYLLPAPTVSPGLRCMQIAASYRSALALMSDGSILAWGNNDVMQSHLPRPVAAPPSSSPPRFSQVSAGTWHDLAVDSDGQMYAWGTQSWGVCNVPTLPAGVRWVKSSAGYMHSAGLRSDGVLMAWGDNWRGRTTVPTLPAGVHYTDVSAASDHNVALCSDGSAVAFGSNDSGQCVIPPLPAGLSYLQCEAQYWATVLLRSDGVAVRAGYQGGLLATAPAGLSYVKVSTTQYHSAALRSDGDVDVLWGTLGNGYYNRPLYPAPWGISYVEMASSQETTALRRSDGRMVVFGSIGYFQGDIPEPLPGTSYIQVDGGSDTFAGLIGPTSTYISYGHGCAGSQQAARLVPRDTPFIDRTLEIGVLDLPANALIMLFGWRRTGPTSLSAYGMPTCNLHLAPISGMVVAGTAGSAKYRISIPNLPSLVGMRFVNQAIVLDPAANGAGAVLSDAAEGVIGLR